MKSVRLLLLALLILTLAACAPQTRPLKTSEAYFRNPVEQVYPRVIEAIRKAAKPRGSANGWRIVSSDPETGVITAQAYVRRSDPRRGVTQGFARIIVTVEPYRETRSRLTIEVTPGVAENLARRLPGQVRRSLPTARP